MSVIDALRNFTLRLDIISCVMMFTGIWWCGFAIGLWVEKKITRRKAKRMHSILFD